MLHFRRYSSLPQRLRVTSAFHLRTSRQNFNANLDLSRDSRVDLWKRRLSLHVTRASMSPRDIIATMQRRSVSLCVFMPDRLSDPDAHSANQKHFQALSQMLSCNNLVSFNVQYLIAESRSLIAIYHHRSRSPPSIVVMASVAQAC